jgi:hypothetical protein
MRARIPTIARHCPLIWTEEDEREMVSAVIALRTDIDAAGGLDEWVRLRLGQWLAQPAPHPVPHRFTAN